MITGDSLSSEIDRLGYNSWTLCPAPLCYRSGAMDANQLMKANVKRLLELREKEPEDLAKFMRKSASWIDKIYRYDSRTFPIRYYQTIANFLGVDVYQLLQPGIADRAERRSGAERRKVIDRRVSKAVISEKALDVDLIHVVRAMSHGGRQKAIGLLMDILNDELAVLRRPRAIAEDGDDPDHTDGTPRSRRAPKRKG